MLGQKNNISKNTADNIVGSDRMIDIGLCHGRYGEIL
jgi:hypothetical protein